MAELPCAMPSTAARPRDPTGPTPPRRPWSFSVAFSASITSPDTSSCRDLPRKATNSSTSSTAASLSPTSHNAPTPAPSTTPAATSATSSASRPTTRRRPARDASRAVGEGRTADDLPLPSPTRLGEQRLDRDLDPATHSICPLQDHKGGGRKRENQACTQSLDGRGRVCRDRRSAAARRLLQRVR